MHTSCISFSGVGYLKRGSEKEHDGNEYKQRSRMLSRFAGLLAGVQNELKQNQGLLISLCAQISSAQGHITPLSLTWLVKIRPDPVTCLL